jgi:tRNA-(ms[2]io[6]A)-hydroxylase
MGKSGMNKTSELLQPILSFLHCETPKAWVSWALANQALMLIDHCNCEKKAASTALSLIYRYTDRDALLMKMSKLAREELRHFEQVLKIMKARKIKYETITASRYAQALIKEVRTHEPAALVDKLIIGAYIEARSCERFAKIAPLLDENLGDFYRSLLKSESRHFMDYLHLAQFYSEEDISERVDVIGQTEAKLILSVDKAFRFHSGVPK